MFRAQEMLGPEGEVMAGQDVAVPGPFFAWSVLKAHAPGPILCCLWVQSCCWHWGGGPTLGGHGIKGRECPVCRSKLCCWRCSSSTSVSQLVASWQGEGSFSPACPGKLLIIQPWEGKLGAACLGACPALITCPGIHAQPALEAIRHPSWLPGAWPGCCPLSLLLAAPQFLALASGPCCCFIPSVVQLW